MINLSQMDYILCTLTPGVLADHFIQTSTQLLWKFLFQLVRIINLYKLQLSEPM